MCFSMALSILESLSVESPTASGSTIGSPSPKTDTVRTNKNEMCPKILTVLFIEVLLLLSQNVADDVSVDICETEISTLEAVGRVFRG